jgi:hypothetical protein
MAGPFLLGVLWCLRSWRRPPAVFLLLWVGIMLGPTILAEDTPHFLRASGMLPALVLLPAVGLERLWCWVQAQLGAGRRAAAAATGLVGLLVAGSGLLTLRDYAAFSLNPETGYLFEQAAREMAAQINRADADVAQIVDDRFWSGWPSIPFLVTRPGVRTFVPEEGVSLLELPVTLYAWPYGPLDFLPAALPASALVWPETGAMTRGDLELEAYPLYTRYQLFAAPDLPALATFGAELTLRQAVVAKMDASRLQVDLIWEAETAVVRPVTAFVHIVGPEGLVAQVDAPPGAGAWPFAWWRPGLLLQERRIVQLPQPYDPAQHQLWVGLYDSETGVRLPVTVDGAPAGDALYLAPGT